MRPRALARRAAALLIVFVASATAYTTPADAYARPPPVAAAQSDAIRPATIREPPRINAVSAMCSSDGITASLAFDRPFSGRIYSRDYSLVPECVYYDGSGQHTILFSIPAHRCGTKLTRTTRNVIDQMENRVYVQMDKITQTADDKQFAFVCQLAAGESAIAANGTSGYQLSAEPIVPYTTSPALAHSSDAAKAQTATTGSYVTQAFISDNKVAYDAAPIIPVVSLMITTNSEAVRRVAAVSRDGHFGNWPIPGAKPFSPDMRPVASWPTAPLSPPVNGGYAAPPSFLHSPTVAHDAHTTFSHSLEPSHVTRPLFPPLTPVTPAPRAPPMPSHIQAADAPQRRPPSFPSSSASSYHHPFLFSPLVGVRTEAIQPGGGREAEVEARPWNDAVAAASRDWSAHTSAYKTAAPIAAVSSNGGRWPPVDSGRHAVAANDHLAADYEQGVYARPPPSSSHEKIERPAPAPQQPAHVDTGAGLFTDGTITRDFTTPPPAVTPPAFSSSVDLDENRVDDAHNANDEEDASAALNRMIAAQDASAVNTAVFLEIQKGNGPHDATISKPVKIGDNITLVVRAKSMLRGENEFDMFVHSCFATDGPGTGRVELIDKNGCTTRPAVAGTLQRSRDANGEQLYFFRISAFKFPGPDDVYFSCSVDMTPGHAAPEICRTSTSRKRRELLRTAFIRDGRANSVRIFDNLKVEINDDDGDSSRARIGRQALSSSSSPDDPSSCLDANLLPLFLLISLSLLLALLATCAIAIRQTRQLRRRTTCKVYS